jgi:GT2 family glycosyltransferase
MPVVDSERRLSAPGPILKASIVVPVCNGARTLRRCLEAIFASQGIGEFEVIVVDDASTDASADIAAGFACRLIRRPRRRGPAAARNDGAQKACAPRLVFVDADVFVRPNTLALLLKALDSSPAAFGSYDPQPLNLNFATVLYQALACRSLGDTAERTPVFYSYCAAIWRDLFLELGGFDISFTLPTFEDMELGCRLATRSLLSRHVSDAQVVHAVRYDLLGLARAYFHKSRDLAWLLLSRRSLSFADQGWTHRKNWVLLASAWATLGLAPLAIWVHPLWVLPWALAALTFLVGSSDLYRTMARRRWIYGPLALLAFLGINCIATSGMLIAALHWLTGFRRRPGLAQFTGEPVRSKKGKERSLGSVENS